MTYVTGKTYAFLAVLIIVFSFAWLLAALFLAAAFLLPPGNMRDLGVVGAILLCFIVSPLLLLWVWKSSSSPSLSFFAGLETISSCLMSGCFPLTVIYIFPILIVVYLIALFNTCIGLAKGKTYTQERWIGLVNWFRKLRHGY